MRGLIDCLSQHSAMAIATVRTTALLESMPVIDTGMPGSSTGLVGNYLVDLQVLEDPRGVAVGSVVGANSDKRFSSAWFRCPPRHFTAEGCCGE